METIKKVISTATELLDDSKSRDLKSNTVDECKPGSVITANFGTPISNTDDSLKAGERGPILMEDFHFREKITHFDHERIPERVVHARGAAAHGYFEVTHSLEEFTKAEFLTKTSAKTPVFVRFSTVLGSRGSADTVRDVRGFATKFYTSQGNFDLVGNNIPVFFVQDAIKFLDIIHAGKPEPHNEIPQAQTAHDNFWDFVSLTPETAHMLMWVLSDRAIPRSFRMMQGFGVHSFVLVNKNGKRCFAKFHWTPKLGTHSLVWDEALKLAGVDPDFNRRDLWEAIESGNYPEWELGVQIVDEADEHKFDFDLLDATKIIPEEVVPLRPVGRLVLNRNPDNFFAEVEQAAFHTGHLVPGIEASNDPLLQGRMFSYLDTQLIRLGGPNFEEIPINRPLVPVTNTQRDGYHRMTISKSRVNYFPNRFGCPAVDKMHGYVHQPVHIEGTKIRTRGPKFYDFYSQARMFFNSMSQWEKTHLIDAAKFELGHVDNLEVRQRTVDVFNNIDFEFARELAIAIGVKAPTESKTVSYSRKSPAVSQENTAKNSIQTRKVAFLLGEGHKSSQLHLLSTAFKAAGAIPIIVGPNKGPVKGDTGSPAEASFSYFTCKSVLFDALVLVGGKQSVDTIRSLGDAMTFINESFKHCKPIVALDEAVNLLQLPGIKVASGDTVVSDQGVVTVKNLSEKETLVLKKDGPSSFGTAVFEAIAKHRHYLRSIATVSA